MRSVALMLLVTLSLLVAGCQPAEPPAEPMVSTQPAAPDPAVDRAAIDRLRDDWIAASEKDDAMTVAGFYTDDAVHSSPDDPEVQGREAIQALWTRLFPAASGLKIRSLRQEVSGDLAYDYGEYTQRITPPKGKPMDVTGRYLVVLKRQPDGAWKLVNHTSFPLFPAAQKAAQKTR